MPARKKIDPCPLIAKPERGISMTMNAYDAVNAPLHALLHPAWYGEGRKVKKKFIIHAICAGAERTGRSVLRYAHGML
jgi:hypothetical protein